MVSRVATHLDIAIGQQQIHDDVRAQQLYTVQPPLQASQLLPQLLPTEPLPSLPDILTNGLSEIAADVQDHWWGEKRERGEPVPSAPANFIFISLYLVPPPCEPHYQESVGVASNRRTSRPTRGVRRASALAPACTSPSAMPLRRPASPHKTRPVAVTT